MREFVPESHLLPGSVAPDGIRCNTIVRRYPSGAARVICADRRIFRIPGYEEQLPRSRLRAAEGLDRETAYAVDERLGIEYDGEPSPEETARAAANLNRARRRAAAAVTDYALANDFKYFVTLTFDRQRVDRWDDTEVLRVTKNWLDNMVRRWGLSYVLVPERHKDGAIHFHGFFNGAVEGVDSGHKTTRGQIIYNLPRWAWGFTTAIEVYGEYGAAVGYVCKYITKGGEKVGGRWYYHGGRLLKPEVEYINTEWEEVSKELDTVSVPGLGARLVYLNAERMKNG